MDVSVICPFYNEEPLIVPGVRSMLANLQSLKCSWELLLVNDGSTDGSLSAISDIVNESGNVRTISYQINRGRGYALRTGIAAAQGKLVITTEIDLSWGENVVHDIIEAFQEHPDADMIIASPHLKGGGYRNVPFHRVALSRIGNIVIRTGLRHNVTMSTGMTRGYKRQKVHDLPLTEDRKELHLEIVNKAVAFGYRIYEIPAVLEWKKPKSSKKKERRMSSTRIGRSISSHLLFSLIANPIQYIWPVGALFAVVSLASFVRGVIRLVSGNVAIYSLQLSLLFLILSGFCFAIGIITAQLRDAQKDLWRIQGLAKRSEKSLTFLDSTAFDEDGTE